MAEKVTTKLRIKSGSLELDFEGNEAFLRSEVPKLVRATTDLQVLRLSESIQILQSQLQESLIIKADLDTGFDEIKSSIASVSEEKRLRLQMAMDHMNRALQTISNILKKSHDTASQIIQNLKS